MSFENPLKNENEKMNEKINIDLLLEELKNRDISIRNGINQYLSGKDKHKITIRNTEELKNLIELVGWDQIFKTTERIDAFWLITQHSDHNHKLQEYFFYNFYKRHKELIKNNQNFEKAISMSVAMLRDRFLTNKYGWQVYGSQFDSNEKIIPVLKDEYIKNSWKILTFDSEYFLNLNNKNDFRKLEKRRIKNSFPENTTLIPGDGLRLKKLLEESKKES